MSGEALIWILWSYLVGSLPFGYWITRLTLKENLLLIGYKKSSGSNVIKYVGAWQGVLTILLDISKGFLVVFLAREIGLASWVQIISALAVVIGHNWSPFLNFAGGRGIAALIGALLALSLPITAVSLIVFGVMFVVWDASIGTLLVFPTVILLSYIAGQFETIGIFALLVLFPVLLKRLSPWGEISNFNLFIRRLLRDGDTAIFDFRIVRLFQRYPSAFKPIISPFLLVINIIRRMRGGVPPVLFLSPQDMAKLLSAGAKKSMVHQEEVNQINVFPVAEMTSNIVPSTGL